MHDVARVHEVQRREHAADVVPEQVHLHRDVLGEVEGEVAALDVLLEHVEVEAALLLLVRYPVVPVISSFRLVFSYISFQLIYLGHLSHEILT